MPHRTTRPDPTLATTTESPVPSKEWIDDRVVLVTGGTGSFGQKFVEYVLTRYGPRKLIVFSRDELKQFEMQRKYPIAQYPQLRFFLGDVRDRERLSRAFEGVDVIVHAAALKQVPATEYNPLEAVKTNVLGAANVVDAAIDRNVQRVIALSTDKAASPINLYGATKLCADKIFSAASSYSGTHGTRFGSVRYGNVMGSRGSVVPLFLQQAQKGRITITDPRMTRFWITLEHGVRFVLESLGRTRGGELFVPKIPSMNILDLAKAIAPECEIDLVGIRPGEKIHETMLPEDDALRAVEYPDHFALLPSSWSQDELHEYCKATNGQPCAPGFRYSSDNNTWWLTQAELRGMLGLPPLGQAVIAGGSS